ncbi:MAG: hypothetical protein JWN24_770 [Phycisphaerales bacterium]|nr:hypothetical protein [Phycisphaerales bacterium]
MGTLGNQPIRENHRVDSSHVDNLLSEYKDIAKSQGVTVECVIEAKKVLELERRNTLAVVNGDYFDEQMGGFGEKLSELAAAISEIAGAMREKDG